VTAGLALAGALCALLLIRGKDFVRREPAVRGEPGARAARADTQAIPPVSGEAGLERVSQVRSV